MFTLEVHGEAQAEMSALPSGVKAKLIRQLDKLRTNPLVLREPDSKPLGNGLSEIRTVGFFLPEEFMSTERG